MENAIHITSWQRSKGDTNRIIIKETTNAREQSMIFNDELKKLACVLVHKIILLFKDKGKEIVVTSHQ
jgi:hypothetical protein